MTRTEFAAGERSARAEQPVAVLLFLQPSPAAGGQQFEVRDVERRDVGHADDHARSGTWDAGSL
jgi:hypothetical protein